MWIPAGRITEDQLRREGRTFERTRTTLLELSNRDVFYRKADANECVMDGYIAEKSDMQKVTDSVMMVAGTPVTLVLDGVVVGTWVFLVRILGLPD